MTMDKQPAPTLCTPRLTLREIALHDTASIVAWRSDPSVYCYFLSPHPLTAAEHTTWYTTRYRCNPDRYDWLALADGIPAGVFGLVRLPDGGVEVNYLLAPQAQGRGYAAEAVTCLLGWAADHWNARYALAEIHRRNQPSLRFAQTLGFTPQETRGDFLLYRRAL